MEFSTILNSELLQFQALDFSLATLSRKLGMALILGTLLSIIIRKTQTENRVKRLRTMASLQYAHIFLCLGGAFIMIIINNSLANAFGLTGALSVIRFRTNLIEPKDGALIILIIAIGMACGLEMYATAAIVAGIVSVVLVVMAWHHRRTQTEFPSLDSPKERRENEEDED